MTTESPRPDPVAVESALRSLILPGTVFEIRPLAVKQRYGAPADMSGFFDQDHISEAATAACALGTAPMGVYLTVNPVVPDLLARRAYRIERAGKGEMTSDHEVAARATLLIDCDFDRPRGICATDAEHDAALDMARRIRVDLMAAGWPEPFFVDSGNGGQMWFRLDLPVDDGGLVQRALAALGARYDDGPVHIDQSVFNPSRIGRLPGTVNCKGDNVPFRPHRLAHVLSAPESLDFVPINLLEDLAGKSPAPPGPKLDKSTTVQTTESGDGPQDGDGPMRVNLFGWTRELVEKFMAEKLADCAPGEADDYKNGWRWKLGVCPFDSAHANSAAIFFSDDRGPAFHCLHNSCREKRWRDLLKKYKVKPPNIAVKGTDDRPLIYLPGGAVPIKETAGELGELLSATQLFFVRGGAVVRLDQDVDGLPMLREVKPAALASDFETVATLAKVNNAGQVAPATCTESAAKLIGAAATFRDALPPIHVLTRCPVLIERDGGLVQVCGYDRESGTMAGGDPAVDDVSLSDARDLLNELVADFRFPSDADRARALAAFLTPALVLGSLLPARAPIDLAEADASQSGKGYRMRLKSAVYGETVKNITQKRDGGVGGMEESFNAALIRGACFICLDNIRGKIDSPAIESFLTEDTYNARCAYSANMEIDPRRVVLMMTSNKADVTTDLANRSACVRILKQVDGYTFRRYSEGDILDHVRANQPRFLGAVFAVIRAWYAAGRPRTNETRHDFRRWAQTLDWMTRELLEAGPLLDGHRETQQRMTNPALNWLRDVALAVVRAHKTCLWLRAGDLVDLLSETEVEVPGLPEHGDPADPETRKSAQQATGRKLGLCFRDGTEVRIDHLRMTKREQYCDIGRYTVKEYFFTAADDDPKNKSLAATSAANPQNSPSACPPPLTDEEYAADEALFCGYAAADRAADETRVAADAADTPLIGKCFENTSNISTNISSYTGTISRIAAKTAEIVEGDAVDLLSKMTKDGHSP